MMLPRRGDPHESSVTEGLCNIDAELHGLTLDVEKEEKSAARFLHHLVRRCYGLWPIPFILVTVGFAASFFFLPICYRTKL